MVHGDIWTQKELFVYPNEFIYWSVQIVLYPYITGLLTGTYVLSSFYYVFDRKEVKELAQFSLLFSLALAIVSPMPHMLHLQHPLRGMNVFFTPHFTSAIAAFGVVFFTFGSILASQIWFEYRIFFVQMEAELKQSKKSFERLMGFFYGLLTLGARMTDAESVKTDRRATKLLSAFGIPVVCFLHGYAGFIFGSVKANALWMTPLMPVIFIMSAIVSGIGIAVLAYIIAVEISGEKLGERTPNMTLVKQASKYLIFFISVAVTLELLDLIYRAYTAVKHWDIIREVIYHRDFVSIFVLQYLLGNLVPLVLFLLPGLTVRRAVVGILLIQLGVFMMRWNVVIGGQSFSLTLSGYMHYVLPIIPHDIETLKEGLVGVLFILGAPVFFLWMINKIIPVLHKKTT